MKRPTNQQIEDFYNYGKEDDVQYCKFECISPKLVETIKEILTKKLEENETAN